MEKNSRRHCVDASPEIWMRVLKFYRSWKCGILANLTHISSNMESPLNIKDLRSRILLYSLDQEGFLGHPESNLVCQSPKSKEMITVLTVFLKVGKQNETSCFYFGGDIPTGSQILEHQKLSWQVPYYYYYYYLVFIFISLSCGCLDKVSGNLSFPALRILIMILFMPVTNVMSCRLGSWGGIGPKVWLRHAVGAVHKSLLDYTTYLSSDHHCYGPWFLFSLGRSWLPLDCQCLPPLKHPGASCTNVFLKAPEKETFESREWACVGRWNEHSLFGKGSCSLY